MYGLAVTKACTFHRLLLETLLGSAVTDCRVELNKSRPGYLVTGIAEA